MAISIERRATERFPLKLPMTVRWTTPSGETEAHTESQDVSSGGIYFFLSRQIEDGSPVEIEMILLNEVTLAGRMFVWCKGHVQRIDAVEPNRIGVAAQIEHYQFLRGNEETRGLQVAKA
jgi:hypothetical protein